LAFPAPGGHVSRAREIKTVLFWREKALGVFGDIQSQSDGPAQLIKADALADYGAYASFFAFVLCEVPEVFRVQNSDNAASI